MYQVPITWSDCQKTVANVAPRTMSRHFTLSPVININAAEIRKKLVASDPTSSKTVETQAWEASVAIPVSTVTPTTDRASRASIPTPRT